MKRIGTFVSRSEFNVCPIVFATPGDAEMVLDFLKTHIEQHGDVSLAVLNRYIGMETYNDRNLGWTDLSKGKITPTNIGPMLYLPQPELLTRDN